MKLKSLILGSVAVAGLTAGAQAADLGVLASFDVCEELGMTGLTLSSDTNCLKISGSTDSEFHWGDYQGTEWTVGAINFNRGDNDDIHDNNGAANSELDWETSIDAWLQFEAGAASDFGTAKAVLKFDYDNDTTVENEVLTEASTDTLRLQDAYVQVGDQTVLMVGQKNSIFKNGDDVPLNFLGLFLSQGVDTGVDTPITDAKDGDPRFNIQVVSDLGDGWSVGLGLENLDGSEVQNNPILATDANDDGNLVGYVAYGANGISAHVSMVAGGFLDGTIEDFGFHAGITATVDQFKFVAAVAGDDNGYWNALASGSATFDMFTIALSGEYANNAANVSGLGFGGSIGAAVTDTVSINLGARYFDDNTAVGNTETWQAAIQVVAAVTETVKLTGEVGFYSTTVVVAEPDVFYGKAEAAWAPGGGFTASVAGEVNSIGAYKLTTKAAKSFQ